MRSGSPESERQELQKLDEPAAPCLSQGQQRGLRPHARPAIVNGTAGLIVPADVGLRAVVGFSVVGGKVTAIDLITDREKLRRLRLS